MRWINNSMELSDLVGDVLERGFPIGHTIQYASKGPHISLWADLQQKQRALGTAAETFIQILLLYIAIL